MQCCLRPGSCTWHWPNCWCMPSGRTRPLLLSPGLLVLHAEAVHPWARLGHASMCPCTLLGWASSMEAGPSLDLRRMFSKHCYSHAPLLFAPARRQRETLTWCENIFLEDPASSCFRACSRRMPCAIFFQHVLFVCFLYWDFH